MRKIVVLCLLALCLISCSKGNTTSSQTDAPKGFVVGIDKAEETVKEATSNTVSDIKEAVKEGTEAIKEVVQVPIYTWTIIEEKDSFGDPTGKKEVVLLGQKGTYNSSPYGITDGELEWEFHCNESSAWVILKERGYDRNLSTAYLKSDTFTIKVKTDDGSTKTITDKAAIGLNGGSYNKITIPSSDIKEMLSDNNSLKMVISCNNGNGFYNLGNIDCSACNEDMFFKGRDLIGDTSNLSTHKQIAELIKTIQSSNLDKDSKNYYVNKLKKLTFDYPNYSGGIIFYDCDEDNDSGNADGLKSSECGWRYLEATSEFETNRKDYPYSVAGVCKIGTKYRIGTGKSNTEMLVKAIGDKTSEYYDSKGTTSEYAARICNEYEYNGYDDWFLPSEYELEKLIETVNALGLLRKFTDYWSSTTYKNYINRYGYPSTSYFYFDSTYNRIDNDGDSTSRKASWPVRAFK